MSKPNGFDWETTENNKNAEAVNEMWNTERIINFWLKYNFQPK